MIKFTVGEIEKKGQKGRPEIEIRLCDKIFRKLSKYVSWALIQCKFTPNAVTLSAMLVAVIAGVLLGFGDKNAYVAGAFLLLVFLLLDYCDGEVARYLGRQSMTGNYLDYMAHFVMFASFLVGLSCGIYQNNPSILALLLGTLGVAGILIRSLASVLIWEVICVENLRIKKRLVTSNQSVEHTVTHNVASNKERLKTTKRSIFRKILSLVQRPSGGDSLVIYFFPAAIANYFVRPIMLGKWVIGVMDVYFLYLCSVNVAVALWVIARNTLKRKVEFAYNDFFINEHTKIKR